MAQNSLFFRESDEKFVTLLKYNKQKQRDIIIVDGIKKIGKSTLIKNRIQHASHVWLDLNKDRVILKEIEASHSFSEFQDILSIRYHFIPNTGLILVIDGAHESKIIGSYIAQMKELWQNQTVILIVSNISLLLRERIKELDPYIVRHTVMPLSFAEFLVATGENYLHDQLANWNIAKPFTDTLHTRALEVLENYLNIGGIPTVVESYLNGQSWNDFFVAYFFDYVAEYKSLHGEERANLFEESLRKTAQSLGMPSKLTTIIPSLKRNYRSVSELFFFLEQLGLVYKIPLKSPAEKKESGKTSKIPPKRYLCDHGIRDHFNQLPLKLLSSLYTNTRTPKGFIKGILENFVLCELKARGLRDAISWRQKINGSEISFIIKTSTNFIPIDIRPSPKTNKKFFSSLQACMSEMALNQSVLFSADKGRVIEFDKQRILQVPFYCVAKL
ncbi:MAG: hypothetical protein ACD_62C00538G0003 [uncultured bacterium]|nr:MAG: hypothetical protein ACD_62C00538G0003 [uncultured bacterium]